MADVVWDKMHHTTTPTTQLRDALAETPGFRGTWLYVNLMHHFVRLFTDSTITPEAAVKCAGYCSCSPS